MISRAKGFEHILGHGLDRALCAYWHKYRRFNSLVGEMDAAAPSARRGFCNEIESEAHFTILTGAAVSARKAEIGRTATAAVTGSRLRRPN